MEDLLAKSQELADMIAKQVEPGEDNSRIIDLLSQLQSSLLKRGPRSKRPADRENERQVDRKRCITNDCDKDQATRDQNSQQSHSHLIQPTQITPSIQRLASQKQQQQQEAAQFQDKHSPRLRQQDIIQLHETVQRQRRHQQQKFPIYRSIVGHQRLANNIQKQKQERLRQQEQQEDQIHRRQRSPTNSQASIASPLHKTQRWKGTQRSLGTERLVSKLSAQRSKNEHRPVASFPDNRFLPNHRIPSSSSSLQSPPLQSIDERIRSDKSGYVTAELLGQAIVEGKDKSIGDTQQNGHSENSLQKLSTGFGNFEMSRLRFAYSGKPSGSKYPPDQTRFMLQYWAREGRPAMMLCQNNVQKSNVYRAAANALSEHFQEMFASAEVKQRIANLKRDFRLAVQKGKTTFEFFNECVECFPEESAMYLLTDDQGEKSVHWPKTATVRNQLMVSSDLSRGQDSLADGSDTEEVKAEVMTVSPLQSINLAEPDFTDVSPLSVMTDPSSAEEHLRALKKPLSYRSLPTESFKELSQAVGHAITSPTTTINPARRVQSSISPESYIQPHSGDQYQSELPQNQGLTPSIDHNVQRSDLTMEEESHTRSQCGVLASLAEQLCKLNEQTRDINVQVDISPAETESEQDRRETREFRKQMISMLHEILTTLKNRS